jgi:hypothetical protein
MMVEKSSVARQWQFNTFPQQPKHVLAATNQLETIELLLENQHATNNRQTVVNAVFYAVRAEVT